MTEIDESDSTKNAIGDASADSDERYRILVSNVKDYAIFMIDPEGIILSWNEGAEIMKGYKASEIIGKSFKCFYSREDIERMHPDFELKSAYELGRYQEESWRFRKDGSRFWANVLITRVNDASGKHIGYAKITRDMTERKKAEEIVREGEERFRVLVETVKDYAIIMLDTDGKITSWNEGARRLKGYEPQEIIGQHFSKFYLGEEVVIGKCEYELKEASLTGRFEDEGWRVRKDGSQFWANVVITALRGRGGDLRGFAKVTRDMTERKRAEEKLRMAHQGLEIRVEQRTRELQKAVEARDEFLAIASHELRTPLAALKLQHQLLELEIEMADGKTLPNEKLLELSSTSARQVDQLLRLVEDMVDVSRIETGVFHLALENLSANLLIAQAIETSAALLARAGISVESEVAADLMIYCDGQRITQVLSNLLGNCAKYAPRSKVRVTAKRDASRNIEISIHDTGPGIAKKDQERVFERFERAVTPSEISGLGLGLYISRQIAASHHGELLLESEPGKGTTFRLILPDAPLTP